MENNMLKIMNYALSLGGFLNGYKTILGAALYLFAEVALKVPSLADSYNAVLNGAQSASEVLVALGIIHWKVKDIVK